MALIPLGVALGVPMRSPLGGNLPLMPVASPNHAACYCFKWCVAHGSMSTSVSPTCPHLSHSEIRTLSAGHQDLHVDYREIIRLRSKMIGAGWRWGETGLSTLQPLSSAILPPRSEEQNLVFPWSPDSILPAWRDQSLPGQLTGLWGGRYETMGEELTLRKSGPRMCSR